MRLQTSIEFIAILSAVVAFVVFALGVYAHVTSAQNHAFNSIEQLGSENTIFSGNASGAAAHVSLSLPPFSYANRTNDAYIIASLPSGYSIETLAINGTGSISLSPDSFTDIMGGLAILNVSYIPKAVGTAGMSFNALVVGPSSENYMYESANTTVIYANQGGGANESGNNLQAAINTYNESAQYTISSPQNISKYIVWQHCPDHNWIWGNILPEPSQCGGNTWGFIINGNCDQQDAVGWDMYVCVRQNSTGQNVSTFSARYARNYSIGVSLYNSTLKLHANLTSSENSSSLVNRNGLSYGNITVSSVSGDGYLPEPYASFVLLRNGTGAFVINQSYYSGYSSIATTLQQDLHAYNGTWLQDNSYSLIMSLVNSTNSGVGTFGGAMAANNPGCELVGKPLQAYTCSPFSQFSYDISVYPSNSFKVQNQSVDVGTSVVSVK